MIGLSELFLVNLYGFLMLRGGNVGEHFRGLHLRFKVSMRFVGYYLKDHFMLCYVFSESRLVCIWWS